MADKMETPEDIRLLAALQAGIAPTHAPFKEVAERLGMREEEVLERVEDMIQHGSIRRFGATLNPRKAGFKANALIAWKVPEVRMAAVAGRLARDHSVTHCYRRRPVPGRWDYSLYTMVHGQDRATVTKWVGELAAELEVKDFVIMFTEAEHKSAGSAAAAGRD